MNRYACSILLTLLALSGCEDGKAAGDGATGSASAAAPAAALPKLTGKTPSSISAERPEAKTGDDPEADYKNFDELYKAQKDAIGKTVLFRGYGTPLRPDFAHLAEAKPSTERANILEATFKPEQQALMRAMPSNQFVQGGQCPRVHVKITGFNEKRRYPQGEVIDVYDVQPDPAPKNLPAGVDFIAMDDVFLAGKSAIGKVADFGVYLNRRDDSAESWVVVTSGCSPHGGWNAQLLIPENDSNRPFFESLKKEGPSTCVRIRAKLTMEPPEALVPRWGAELLATGETYNKPHPPPNP